MTEDFIRTYENVLGPDDCQAFIEAFEDATKAGPCTVDPKSIYGGSGENRADSSVFFDTRFPQAHNQLHARLKPLVGQYMMEFPTLGNKALHSEHTKVQKTLPGEGYHVWHAEWSGRDNRRTLVWLLYLNDVSPGGETEFLNQHLRVQPKAGTLIVWPAYWPWVHRGNPPLTGAKYIATGWYLNHGD